MSKLLRFNTSFLRLLLKTTKQQAFLLLQNTTQTQALVISEIALNLLTIPLIKKQKKLVERNKTLLKKLSKKKTPYKVKQKLIGRNKAKVYNLLKVVEEQLLHLI